MTDVTIKLGGAARNRTRPGSSPDRLADPGLPWAGPHRPASVADPDAGPAAGGRPPDQPAFEVRPADGLADELAALPCEGPVFPGFCLMREIGRGAFSRVFLARQADLAHRLVVLKVSVEAAGEPQTLAQLQHTNIVPVYSVHRVGPFQVVCLPYFGATTLADVLRSDQTPPSASPPTQADPAAVQTARQRLGPVSAVVDLAARLADGLAHAHERRIIHCDLKPANILLADDGRPMLLDFNVAADANRAVDRAVVRGGTLAYMAPEQLLAVRRGVPEADPRYDLYALGVILFELLTGQAPFPPAALPFAETGPATDPDRRPPLLRPLNPRVSPAVEAIVRRCLEPDPARRYPSAHQLREDLQRHLAHLPLRHTAEPSLRERAAKWARRHPRLTSSGTIATLAAVLLAAFSLVLAVRGRRLAQWEDQARAQADWKAFRDEARTAQFFLYTRAGDPADLAVGEAACTRALERYQVLSNVHWQELAGVRALPAADPRRLREMAAELLLLLARATAYQAGRGPTPPGRLRTAYRLNTLAEACSPAAAHSRILWEQRAELAAALHDQAAARTLRTRAAALPLGSARDYYWQASDHLLHGRPRPALPLLREAVRRDPQNFWAWFVLGVCHDRLGQPAQAEACYSTCTALRPAFSWSYFNRGLAHLRQQDPAQACRDFDQVLRLRPDLTDAYMNRALARQALKDYAAAAADLTEALRRGAPDTRNYFLRARLRQKLHDPAGARRDFAEGLRRPPADEKSWVARGLARLPRDPHAALRDFDQALRLNPRSALALQNQAHVLAEHLHRNPEALAVLNRVVALLPESAAVRSGRGVLLARLGRRRAALKDAHEALVRDTTPPRLYQVACIYALTSPDHADDRREAFRLLACALRAGYGLELLANDPDLAPLRAFPEFQRLARAARTLHPGPSAHS